MSLSPRLILSYYLRNEDCTVLRITDDEDTDNADNKATKTDAVMTRQTYQTPQIDTQQESSITDDSECENSSIHLLSYFLHDSLYIVYIVFRNQYLIIVKSIYSCFFPSFLN